VKLASLLIFAATPALAGPITTATCQDVWAMVETAVADPVQAGAPSLTGNGCVVRDIEVPSEGDYGVAIKIRSARFAGDGLTPTDGWLPLTALNLSLGDIRLTPQIPDATTTWLLDHQSARAGIKLDLDATSSDKVWRLNGLKIDFPGDNQLEMTAGVSGLDLSSRTEAIASLGWARLNALDLSFQMDGFFETYLLMPLGSVLLSGAANPDQRVSQLKAEAVTLIDALPAGSVDAASKSALKDLLADLPNPKGKLGLKVVSDAGFGAPNLMPLVLNGLGDDPAKTLATLLNGVKIEVTWTRAP
jgi:hypothetical protein